VPGVYGLAKVASAPYQDPSQFLDENSKKGHYYEPRATKEKPMWYCVDVAFIKKFKEPVTLSEIRQNSKLSSMMILQPRSRLSITPVSEEHFNEIVGLSN
jgi:predicted RNA-binding protein with PUA-like domain